MNESIRYATASETGLDGNTYIYIYIFKIFYNVCLLTTSLRNHNVDCD